MDELSVRPVDWAISTRPARELLTSRERVIVTDVPALTWTPVPALLVTVAPSSVMLAALSIQTACGPAARMVIPRSTRSWTPTSMTLTALVGAVIVTAPSAW